MSELSPSQFFGRARVTRQALKPKPLSSSKENVNQEVTTGDKKGRKAPFKKIEVEVRKGRSRNIPDKKSEPICQLKRAKRTSVQDTENKTTKKSNNANKKISQQDDGLDQVKKSRIDRAPDANKEVNAEEAAVSGPVYQNVRRSDVVGDPFEEYDFPFDENSTPVKKKRKPRKANPKKTTVSKVDYLKLSIGAKVLLSMKSKATSKKKPLTHKSAEKKGQQLKVLREKSISVASCKPAISKEAVSSVGLSEEFDEPTDHQPSAVDLNNSIGHNDVASRVKCPSQTVMNAQIFSRLSSPTFRFGNHCTSTPVLKSIAAASSKNTQHSTLSTSRIKSSGLVPVRAASTGAAVASVSPHVTSTSFVSPACSQQKTTPVTNKQNVQTVPSTGSRGLTPITLLSINVRQSPSFKDPEPTTVSPPNASAFSSSLLPATPSAKSSASMSAPGTTKILTSLPKSTPTVLFTADHPSPSLVTSSPVPVSDTPARPSWNSCLDETFSGLFDESFDNCKVSLPARMLRGTICARELENYVTKRKLPELSVAKTERAPRATAVKFSVPKPNADSSDTCFGFDDEEDTFIPQQRAEPSQIKTTRALTVRTKDKDTKRPHRQLSIGEVQALLMGHTRLSAPGGTSKSLSSSTPRSVQTKLTDFISATPTSTPVRSAPKEKPDVLTPTPIPLFGEEQLNDVLPSPFVHASRRSYDRFRPVKRIAYGDEVHSDDEGEETTGKEFPETTCVAKKKNKSYRKKKTPRDTQLDSWANQLTSHFDEVEEVSLEIE